MASRRQKRDAPDQFCGHSAALRALAAAQGTFRAKLRAVEAAVETWGAGAGAASQGRGEVAVMAAEDLRSFISGWVRSADGFSSRSRYGILPTARAAEAAVEAGGGWCRLRVSGW